MSQSGRNFTTCAAANFRALLRDDAGATALEYSLLASLIAVVIAGIVSSMFYKLSSEYGEISSVFK